MHIKKIHVHILYLFIIVRCYLLNKLFVNFSEEIAFV